ncbi:copper chaperone NosL [Oikeobacillus pervagus]|uniref:Copper chaperone NosL n=1 Tax=Oikeobacillus pervagus TaxID=1325931 RepID=A0AAJ1T6I0_9BACI|nr:nitrous oxide reductase accessory protein NosL [Oikeobacillus pervagus]MDQ0215525.1 copper chaperone NosL [Oikeobacillus pervagus]
MKKLWIIPIMFILVACGKEASLDPVEINPDIDVCHVCNMSITETDFATEVIFEDGKVEKFDDLGCMIEYVKEHKDEKIAKKYVKETKSGDWIELEKASFAFDREFWTPMSYGVLPFRNEDEAKKYIQDEGTGRIISYDELWAHRWGVEQ